MSMEKSEYCVTIDGRTISVAPGTTVLQAARQLGIDIPTLCYLEGLKPQTSCLVCTVKVVENGRVRMMPSCGTPVSDGMVVESETQEVAHLRRRALELILSDHVGDCFAPCYFACPAHMDIPSMLRHIQAGRMREAIATIKRDLALPATLGWICPRPCEKGCRRHVIDESVSICQLKRFVAEEDLKSGSPYLPACRPDSGRSVAVVGAGPTGLSAAYYLRQAGHRVTVFDSRSRPGGRIRDTVDPGGSRVPVEILEAEIATVFQLGVEYRAETPLVPEGQSGVTLSTLLQQFDAVLLAFGEQSRGFCESLGLSYQQRGVTVDRATFETSIPRVFAAGNAIRGRGLVVRSCADGKLAAQCIDGFLRENRVQRVPEPFAVRIGRMEKEELNKLAELTKKPSHSLPSTLLGNWDAKTAAQQAERCLHCDCRALPVCRLRQYAERYGVDPNRYRGDRSQLEIIQRPSGIVFEPGKCILCGICVEITESARAPLGLTFIGRGFDVRVGVPFNRSLEEALGDLAEQCVAACPTGALAFREGKPLLTLPVLSVNCLQSKPPE